MKRLELQLTCLCFCNLKSRIDPHSELLNKTACFIYLSIRLKSYHAFSPVGHSSEAHSCILKNTHTHTPKKTTHTLTHKIKNEIKSKNTYSKSHNNNTYDVSNDNNNRDSNNDGRDRNTHNNTMMLWTINQISNVHIVF